MIRMKGDHHARTPSCFAVADRLPYPDAMQPAGLAVVAGAYVKSVQQCARPRLRTGCTQRRIDMTHGRSSAHHQDQEHDGNTYALLYGLDRLTSVNEQGVNDPQVDQDESDRPKRLSRDKQEIGEGLNTHEDDAEPAGPGRPRDDSKPAARTIRLTIRCHQPHVAGPVLIQ